MSDLWSDRSSDANDRSETTRNPGAPDRSDTFAQLRDVPHGRDPGLPASAALEERPSSPSSADEGGPASSAEETRSEDRLAGARPAAPDHADRPGIRPLNDDATDDNSVVDKSWQDASTGPYRSQLTAGEPTAGTGVDPPVPALEDAPSAVEPEEPPPEDRFEGHERLDHLIAAADVVDRGGYTVAGRSLTKHAAGQRLEGGLFPPLDGNTDAINETASRHVRAILTDSGVTRETGKTKSGEVSHKYFAPDGRGVVFSEAGKFLYFAERKRS